MTSPTGRPLFVFWLILATLALAIAVAPEVLAGLVHNLGVMK